MDTERYGDAIPLLERAAGAAGAQAAVHVSLGNAYLNVGRTDDAVASFDRAIDLSPTPMIWNNVAYHLSEKGQRLDRAQQYAESAVTSVSVESRNITLSRVTSRDVTVMGSLASYWDTLGWVAFMKGDLSRAEQLLTAAWRLSESAVMGDHLAQTYEKQGRRDLAIRTYAAVAGLGFDQDSPTRARLRKLVKTAPARPSSTCCSDRTASRTWPSAVATKRCAIMPPRCGAPTSRSCCRSTMRCRPS
jgi:Flp pilus assembly protein TadD